MSSAPDQTVSSRYMARLSKAGIGSHNNITTDRNLFGFGGVESIENVMVDETTAKEAMPYVPSDINNTAYLPFSSGTTGMPKAVEISHSNVISMVEIFCKTPSLLPKNQDRSEMQFRTLNLLPFFHTYALILRLRKVDKSISETAARASRAKHRSFKSYRVVSRCVSLSRCDDLQLDCRAHVTFS